MYYSKEEIDLIKIEAFCDGLQHAKEIASATGKGQTARYAIQKAWLTIRMRLHAYKMEKAA